MLAEVTPVKLPDLLVITNSTCRDEWTYWKFDDMSGLAKMLYGRGSFLSLERVHAMIGADHLTCA